MLKPHVKQQIREWVSLMEKSIVSKEGADSYLGISAVMVGVGDRTIYTQK